MFKVNLRGQIRQTNLPKWKPLLPLFEAVMNSLQAVQERTDASRKVIIEIDRTGDLFGGDEPPVYAFTISDNGSGSNDDNFDSFNTAFSDYKLRRGGKGLGRFTWLKAFERVEVESTYLEALPPEVYSRKFTFDENYDPELAPAISTPSQQIKTRVRLVDFQEPYRSECPKSGEQIAQKLVEHFLLLFLQADCPTIEIHDGGVKISANEVFHREFRASATKHDFEIRGTPFTLHGFRLGAPRNSRHRLTYAAHDRAVLSENLEDYIPNLSGRLADPSGEGSFVYMAVIQSPFLNKKVNHSRTDFEIASVEEIDSQVALFDISDIGRSEIRSACVQYAESDLSDVMSSINASKEEKLVKYVQEEAPHYKSLLRRKEEFISKISPNATKADLDGALHHELYQREVALKKESGRLLSEGAKLESYDEYETRLSQFMRDSNEIGVSALAQYVMHRKIVIDLLEKAISVSPKTTKYPLEKVVHDIIFPMRSTSDDLPYSQQNLWLIDERLNYHAFIASDKPLSSLEHLESDSAKRPDLFIFDRKIAFAEGEHPVSMITLVEFKRPQRDDYTDTSNPLDQVFEAVDDIRVGKFKDGSGRPISLSNDRVPANCFIVCDVTPSLRRLMRNRDYTETPDGQGFVGFHKQHNVYFEVLDYNKLLRDAKRRNKTLFEKLNVFSL